MIKVLKTSNKHEIYIRVFYHFLQMDSIGSCPPTHPHPSPHPHPPKNKMKQEIYKSNMRHFNSFNAELLFYIRNNGMYL